MTYDKVTYIAQTSNKSFLSYRDSLYNQGIMNCDEVLTVKNKELITFNLDEYIEKISSPKYTDYEREETYKKFAPLITEECRSNIWFFFREIFRMKGFNDTYVPFVLTNFSANVIHAYWHKGSVISIIPDRQIGRTVLAVALRIYDDFVNERNIDSSTANSGIIYTYKTQIRQAKYTDIYDSIISFFCKHHLLGFEKYIFEYSYKTRPLLKQSLDLGELSCVYGTGCGDTIIIDDGNGNGLNSGTVISRYEDLLKFISNVAKHSWNYQFIIFNSAPISAVPPERSMFNMAVDLAFPKFIPSVYDWSEKSIGDNIFVLK